MNRNPLQALSSSTQAAILLFFAFTALFGYWFSTLFVRPYQAAVNGAQVAATALLVLFWFSLAVLVLGVWLRRITASFVRALKAATWARVVFPVYLTAHLIVYGIVLERIIIIASGTPPINFGPHAFVSINDYFSPHTLFNALLQMTQNPGIIIVIPPFYGVTLGPFAIFSAVLIGMLVVVHIDRLMRATRLIRRAGGSVIYPAVGIVAGSSCCISLPDLAASASPFAAVIFGTPFWAGVLYVLYYLLPLSVIGAFTVTLRPFLGRRGRQ